MVDFSENRQFCRNASKRSQPLAFSRVQRECYNCSCIRYYRTCAATPCAPKAQLYSVFPKSPKCSLTLTFRPISVKTIDFSEKYQHARCCRNAVQQRPAHLHCSCSYLSSKSLTPPLSSISTKTSKNSKIGDFLVLSTFSLRNVRKHVNYVYVSFARSTAEVVHCSHLRTYAATASTFSRKSPKCSLKLVFWSISRKALLQLPRTRG